MNSPSLMLSLAFIAVECHYPFFNYYYHPQHLMNHYFTYSQPLMNPWFRFNAPAQAEMWLAQQDDPSENSDDGNRIQEHIEARTKQWRKQPENNEAAPRFIFNQNDDNAVIIRPGSNSAIKTLIYATTKKTTIWTTAICFPASAFVADATTCNRRRRDIEAYLSQLIVRDEHLSSANQLVEPSDVQTVQVTAVPSTRDTEPIASSKQDPELSPGLQDEHQTWLISGREKRFLSATRTTLTVWSFSTSTLYRSVTLGINIGNANCPGGNANGAGFVCQLNCIPPPYEKC